MSNHTIDEAGFQQAYKAAKLKAARLPEKLTSHSYTEDEIELLKEGVYKTFLETYLEFINLKG
ncbi:MAG: hypothetical protein V3V81_07630 [Candidatus Bathyarchaeia archaeon]